MTHYMNTGKKHREKERESERVNIPINAIETNGLNLSPIRANLQARPRKPWQYKAREKERERIE